MPDVVVVGGGIAGLAAAWRLRHREVLLLEAEDRVGGRILSERRGPYWLNYGAHVYGGPGSATGWLLDSIGIDAAPVPGTLTGLAMNGRLLTDGRVATYPFRVPMSPRRACSGGRRASPTASPGAGDGRRPSRGPPGGCGWPATTSARGTRRPPSRRASARRRTS